MPTDYDYDMRNSNNPYYPSVTITYGELKEAGFINWNDPAWHWDAYDDDQYKRVCKKMDDHFKWREIGVLPPARWHDEFIRKMNEIMPKYKLLYKILADSPDPMQVLSEYHKARHVYSDFPVTQLRAETQDYASNADDNEEERDVQGDFMEKVQALQAYDDVDLQIINDMSSMFTFFNSTTIPY